MCDIAVIIYWRLGLFLSPVVFVPRCGASTGGKICGITTCGASTGGNTTNLYLSSQRYLRVGFKTNFLYCWKYYSSKGV